MTIKEIAQLAGVSISPLKIPQTQKHLYLEFCWHLFIRQTIS